ncbi:TIR-NBS-LRR-like protein [Parasponia andersonii]|uniref:ADP-ribosyl cyclase/cyclic ADP-ribose hydrolase n=1 Tax=Parasponia andersonii TaxID=3476 RepID=A0A2P5BSY6_PARAD|nr:TIR-NBS-LRR-like protein [Parasponia andersonii]
MATDVAAPSSSSSSSSSSSGRRLWRFDVFLSFRGEDTRQSFTDHLYKALTRRGIHTFRDDKKLKRGKTIAPELLKAIDESRFAIVVLSKDYASSTWCLEELAEIVECSKKETMGLTILPFFYDVEPSEVRKQTGSYAVAFAQHQRDFGDDIAKVNKWRNALIDVANVSGWDRKNRYESEVIEEIVENILQILNNTSSSSVEEHFVGMESRMKGVLSCLDMGSLDNVRTIGMWGMGGIGKTTLAQEVFNRFKDQFEASCFIENVREQSEKHGLVYLQKLLYGFLLESEAKIQNVNMGMNILKDRLRDIKVLIILDDVDKLDQIKYLAGEGVLEQSNWFGPGSRIIVTTRNKKLLTKYGSNVYEVKKLAYYEALQLLCKKAFEKNQPPDGYKEISNEVVKYANGLPLALEVLGSFLFDRDAEEWSSTLARLKEYPEDDIFGPLQVSVDGLRPTERKTFLDIACFFRGEKEIRVKKILEKCECFPEIDIKVLIEKSLITIVSDKLWMHDLLQELGWKIVRQESPFPGERSRLWLYKDAYDVLVDNKGTRAIEGLFLSLPRKQEVQLNGDPFSKMDRLRLLKIRNVNFSSSLGYLSSELRFLEWHRCPLKSFPTDFQPDKLVELNMSNGYIGQLSWKDMRPAKNLILIDLSDCLYLTKTSDFSNIPNLESLILKGCEKLSELHQSVGELKRLVLLNLKGCKNLKRLPHNISLESLEVCILSGCSKLNKFPHIKGNMEKLSELHLDGTAIVELPTSIEHLTGLTLLNLKDCKYLKSLPSVICSLTSLKTLNLSGCSLIDQLPEKLESLECLQELDLSESAIRREPASIRLLKNLEHLSFRGCQGVPHRSWISAFSSYLSPAGRSASTSLQLPNSFFYYSSSLRSLDLSNCNLTQGAIPYDIGRLSSLQQLNLSENNFVSLPNSICQLSELRELKLYRCSNLKMLPELPLSIRSVNASECASLEEAEFQTWISNSTGLSFIICKKSNDWEVERQSLGVPNIHAPPVLQKHFENEINGGKDFQFDFIQSRTPDWPGNSSKGPSITFQLPPDLDNDSRWLGLGLCFLYEIEEIKDSHCSALHATKFLCHFDTDQGCVEKSLMIPVNLNHNGIPTVACRYIPKGWFAGQLNKASYVTASIVTKIPIVEVTMCSGNLIYTHNVTEFVGDVIQLAFVNMDVQDYQRVKDLVETPEASLRITREDLESIEWERLRETKKLSGESENDYTYPLVIHLEKARTSVDRNATANRVKQEGELDSLLSRILKGHHARQYNFGCVFPLRAILPWFTEQSVGQVVTCCLPSDPFDVTTWIGIDLYVNLSWRSVALNNSDPVIHSFLVVDLFTCESARIHREVVPVQRDSIVGPHQLVVVHVPRVHLPEECSYQSLPITAMFRTTASDHVDIEMCGSRVVFKQDLKGFIKTLTECTLESSEVYYQLYKQTFENMEKEMLRRAETSMGDVLEGEMPNDVGYFYRLQREARQKNWEEHLKQKETREEFFIIECLLQDYYQGFNPKLIYNSCFPRNDVPEWFNNYNNSYSVRIQLPKTLKNDSNWIGLALCASFSSEENENQDSHTSQYFVCNLETDKGRVEPIHAYQTPEDQSNWSAMGRFIWLSYLPRGWFSDQLDECSVIEASFGSESVGLKTQKCGLRLLYDTEDQLFKQIILHCMKVFGDYFHFLKQGFDQVSPKFSLDPIIPKRISRDPMSAFVVLYILAETPFRNSHSDSLARWKRKLENLLPYFFKVPLMVVLSFHGHIVSTLLDFDLNFGCNFYYPQKQIPEWFTDQTSNMAKVRVPFSPNLYNDDNWKGYVLCTAFSIHDHPEAIYDNTGSEMLFNAVCHFQMEKYHALQSMRINKESIKWKHVRSFIWITYAPRWWFKDFLNIQEGGYIQVNVVSDSPGLGISRCGIRLLYQQDVEDFKQIIIQSLTSFFDDSGLVQRFLLDRIKKKLDSDLFKRFPLDEIEKLQRDGDNQKTSGPSNYFHVDPLIEAIQSRVSADIFLTFENAVSCKEELTFEDICSTMIQGCRSYNLTVHLTRELHILLSRIFEGHHARMYSFGCIFYPIFSQGAILRWFTDVCLGRLVIAYPPSNLSDDKTWLGIGLYVVLHWRTDVPLDNLDSNAPFLVVDFLTNGGILLHTALFSLRRDSLVGQHRVLLFHVPRVCFPEQQLNQCQQIIALFSTTLPDHVGIGMCGIHLLYQQDLKRFVEVITRCTLGTPGVYYSRYYHTFVNMERKIRNEAETCENDAEEEEMPLDFGYLFSSQRDYECLHKQEVEQDPTSMQLIPGDSRFITSLTRIPTCNESKILAYILKGCNKVFDQTVIYNSCFPPSEVPEWFYHQATGPSVSIQLPKNFHDENDWIGLALWASFSARDHSMAILENEAHDLICHVECDRGSLERLHACRTGKKEFKWLHLGGFIWLSYIPRWWFSGEMNHCSIMEASFGSGLPGLWVEKCGLRLVYEQGNDIQEFGGIIDLCDSKSLENELATEMEMVNFGSSKSSLTYIDIMAETLLYEHHDDSRNTLNGYLLGLLETFFLSSNAQFTLSLGGHTVSILRGFDPVLVHFLCFPQKKIPEWFKNQSSTPKLKIQLRPYLHNVYALLGFALCAAFSVREHPTVIHDNTGAEMYVNLQCRFRIVNEDCDLKPTLRLAKEEFTWKHVGGFIWLIYLPRWLFADSLKQESSIEIELSSDCPDLEMRKCGIHLLYPQDAEEFKRTIVTCFTSFLDDLDPVHQFLKDKRCVKLCHGDKGETNGTGISFVDPTQRTNRLYETPHHLRMRRPVYQGESSGNSSQFSDKSEKMDFDRESMFNLCFPHAEILDWFRHHSNGPSVTIQIPENLHGEVGNWIGLALCAYFSDLNPQHPTSFIENLDMETSHHLICHFQTERSGLEHPHIYRTTNDEFKWLKHGCQFVWLFYIPRKWFSDQLNQRGSVEASFASDNQSLCVQKCGLRLVYCHDEDELKQTIMHCKTSLFENEDHIFVGSESTNKQYHESEPGSSRIGSSTKVDPQQERLEGLTDRNIRDKGKQVLE